MLKKNKQKTLKHPVHFIVHMRAQHKVDMCKQLVVHRHYWAPTHNWLLRKTMEWFVMLEDWDQWLVYVVQVEWVMDKTHSIQEYRERKLAGTLPRVKAFKSLLLGQERWVVNEMFLRESFNPWALVKPYVYPHNTLASQTWQTVAPPIKQTFMWDLQPHTLHGRG